LCAKTLFDRQEGFGLTVPRGNRAVGRADCYAWSLGGAEAAPMRSDLELSPGIDLILFGAASIGVSIGRCVTGWVSEPRRVWFELAHWAVALALAAWGWFRLRRARASRPDLSWREFLGTDLPALGVVATSIVALAAMSSEQRDSLLCFLREFTDAVSIARGGP
jgi:hypothetical protein